MTESLAQIIKQTTNAKSILKTEKIQTLWSGYGEIVRCYLDSANITSIIVKHIQLPQPSHHPRGWNTNISHQRKLKSYEVETKWYQQWANLCSEDCRIPKCYTIQSQKDEILIIMEDLSSSGFPKHKTTVSWNEITACLKWLAFFHATFMEKEPKGLWETGTYWHLETRPDELKALDDKKLRKYASAIDLQLKQSPFQTFVHGDAKLANFCFSENGKEVAAVDFQYVGKGCGMKDVAYFIGSCLDEEECEQLEKKLLDFYFSELKVALKNTNSQLDINEIENDWRKLYPVAWTDFHRFLKGWSPGHWKIHSYSERLSQEVIQQFEK